MHVEATTAAPAETGADTIVVGAFDGEKIAHDLPEGQLAALLASGEAQTKYQHPALTHHDGRRFLLIGLGARDDFTPERARGAAAAAQRRARELGARTLAWEVPHRVQDAVVAGLVEGTLLSAYRFERYKPSENGRDVQTLILSAHHDVSQTAERAAIVARAQNRARDLANTPANDLTPARLAEYAADVEGVSASILDEQEIIAAGMGAFAAVAQGSEQGARLIRLEYRGAGDGSPELALIGKAVTFDSGGISIKPATTMHEMKFDMSGGAAVIEAMAALAELRAPVNVLAVVGATENLPSGRAVKPGDIVRALDGTTIEINNTDAEGRLVLADCISYARRQGAQRLLDIATLTGAIVVTFGSTHAGLLANDDGWAERVLASATRTGELAWQLPLHPEYAELIKGRYAQLVNTHDRREAMSIFAGEFLAHFAGDTPWAHLDIAGTAWDVRRPYFDRGATGYGVRLMVDVALGGADGAG